MREAKQKADAGPPPETRVKSLEELMREAKEKKAAEQPDAGS